MIEMSKMKRFRSILILTTLSLAFTSVVFGDLERTPPQKGMFAQFVGVCQSRAGEAEIWRYLSHIRADLAWQWLQPDGPDQWKQEVLDDFGKTVLHNRAHGVQTLPILEYSVAWAARKTSWSYVSYGRLREIAAYDPSHPDYRDKIVTDIQTGERTEGKFTGLAKSPPEREPWENYVERVVSFLSKAPYNVEYFQIWNEANTKATGFWDGDMDLYMESVHLPAAKIIRKHGCQVVYGGYPSNGTMGEYLGVLDKYNAWHNLDVLSIHYFPLSAWEYLYDRVKHKDRKLGIWQTEFGYTTSKSWVPNNYPRFFHWALTHDWQPDRYRIYQFAYGCSSNKCFHDGTRLSYHGKALVVLGELLDAPKVEAYPYWQTEPVLRTEINEKKSSIEGFHCGDRIVLAIHLADQNGAAIFTDWAGTRDNFHLESDARVEVLLPQLDVSEIGQAWRVGIYGSRLPLEVLSDEDRGTAAGLKIDVPTVDGDDEERKDNRESKMHTFYLLLDLKNRHQ